MRNIKIKEHLTIDDFKVMMQLEKMYYNEEFIAPYNEAFKWYQTYPYTVMVVEDAGQIIGFMNLFPIKNAVVSKIKQGTFNDKYLTTNDIVNIYLPNVSCSSLFLSCVVIHENYRKSSALQLLLKTYATFYSEFEGMRFEDVITDNVTSEGESFSNKLRFKKVCETDHNSVIYEGSFSDFVEIWKEFK